MKNEKRYIGHTFSFSGISNHQSFHYICKLKVNINNTLTK